MGPESVNDRGRMIGQFTDVAEGASARRPGRHESSRHAAVYEFIDNGTQPEAVTVAGLVEGETAYAPLSGLHRDAGGGLWFAKAAAVRRAPDGSCLVRVTRRGDALHVEETTLAGRATEQAGPPFDDCFSVVLE